MNFNNADYLEHHGIKGQKWGVRRYQNTDGSLTPEGKKRQQKEFARYVFKRHNHKSGAYDVELGRKINATASQEKVKKCKKPTTNI